MKKYSSVQTVLHTLGSLIIVLGYIILIPILFIFIYSEKDTMHCFLIPGMACFFSGFLLSRLCRQGKVYFIQSLLICGTAWIVLSLFACLPFFLYNSIKTPFINAYFETISGFTTTGITIFTNIEGLPKSILFWRSLIQWLGGLGIITLFLAVTFKSHNVYFNLFSAESHKIDTARPTPNIFKTITILWSIYIVFTLSEFIILGFLGLDIFDALCHSLTTLSTGGFSPYDSSIDYFRQAGYRNYIAIEYTIIFFMMLGGINFFLHYMIFIGKFSSVIKNTEFKYFIAIIITGTVLILLNHYYSNNLLGSVNDIMKSDVETNFRNALFTVVSIITTTGFTTIDINSNWFFPMSHQILIVLMFIGGCIGSTAGGIKVLRAVTLFKLFKLQIKRLRLPRKAVTDVVIDNRIFPVFEIKRVTGLVLGWLLIILMGGFATAFFTKLDSWQSFSGMFSAMGNIGPCFFSVNEMSELPSVIKIIYIFGMLAGRLEILPVLLIFNRKAWKR